MFTPLRLRAFKKSRMPSMPARLTCLSRLLDFDLALPVTDCAADDMDTSLSGSVVAVAMDKTLWSAAVMSLARTSCGGAVSCPLGVLMDM